MKNYIRKLWKELNGQPTERTDKIIIIEIIICLILLWIL